MRRARRRRHQWRPRQFGGSDFAGRSLQQSASPIADYAETAGRRRKEHDTTDGTQPGDPAKAAEVIIEAVLSAEPPELLLLGQDALDGFRAKEQSQRADVDAWQHRSAATQFEV